LIPAFGIPYFTILNLEQNQIEDFSHRYFAANLLDEIDAGMNQTVRQINRSKAFRISN